MLSPALPSIARHAALGDRAALAAALAEADAPASEVGAALRYHHLIGLVLSVVVDHGLQPVLDATLLSAIEAQKPIQTLTPDALLRGFSGVREALEAAGIPVMLLKGLYFAERLYGAYERRPQFDLDILVRARHVRAAARVLSGLGFIRRAYDLHSMTFVRDGLKVDLHGWLRRAPAYRVDEAAVWQSARTVRVGTLDVLTLSDEYTIVFLGLACFEDIGQAMVRLKQLLDLFLLLRQVDATTDWDAFFARRASEGTTDVLMTVCALVLSLFEGEADATRLAAALRHRQSPLAAATRSEVLALVFAPRKHPANLAWFGRAYPGSLSRYLVSFWAAGFPDNLRQFDAARLVSMLRLAFSAGTPAASSLPSVPGGDTLSAVDAETRRK